MRLRPALALLSHPWLALVFRLYIGGVFIYASMNKINHTAEFANVIADYRILPYWLVNITAVVLPWLELVVGLFLVLGLRVRSAAVTIGAMLAVFIAAIFINLVRGAPIGCGCFNNLEEEMTWLTLVRDLGWLALTVHVYFHDKVLQLERTFFPPVREA